MAFQNCGDPCFRETFPAIEIEASIVTDCDKDSNALLPAVIRIQAPEVPKGEGIGWDDESWETISGSLPSLSSVQLWGTCDGDSGTVPRNHGINLRFGDVSCSVEFPEELGEQIECSTFGDDSDPGCDVSVTLLTD